MKKKINRIYFLFKSFFFEKILIKFYKKEAVFDYIYKTNYWGSDISRSGPGSDKLNSTNIRKILPIVIKKHKIKKIFDAPCGDFYWMNEIIIANNINYLGSDIVKPLIKNNNLKYKNSKITFISQDLTINKFPKSDLWICRALFYHLSFKDIKKILLSFKKSNIKYCLLTNSLVEKEFINKDILTGGYRPLNLFKKPFLFPKNYTYKFTDTYFQKTKKPDQEMIL